MKPRFFRAVLALSVLSSASLVGCDSSVEVESTPLFPDPDCYPVKEPVDLVDSLDSAEIHSIQLIGGVLHLTFSIGRGAAGSRTYLVRANADGTAELIGERPDLSGSRWTLVSGTRYARLGYAFKVEVLDAEDPENPEIATTLRTNTPGYVPGIHGSTLGILDQRVLFYCRVTEEGDNDLMRFDLGAPVEDAWPEAVGTYPCRDEDASTAAGSLWATWGADHVSLWDLATPGAPIVSHAYNTEGVHQYGPLTGAVTDGNVVVATPENDAYVFLFYRGTPQGQVVYGSFGNREQAVLGVVDGVAYVARDRADGTQEIASFDVSRPSEIIETDTAIQLVGAPRGTTMRDLVLDDHDATRLVVRNTSGQVFLAPREGQSAVSPLLITRDGAGGDDACR
jgi:hypothetical protein